MLFIYNKSKKEIEIPEETTFTIQKVMERQDLEEWVAENPKILGLGEDIKIITTEFDKFDKTNERLDILGLDQNGNLLIIELKRDDSGKDVGIQSIKYAAYCSRLTLENLTQIHHSYILKTQKSEDVIPSLEEIGTQLREFIEDPMFEEISNKPRIILVANKFRPEVTSTVMWLREIGLDIICVKLTPYKVDTNRIAFESNILIPLQEAEEFIMRSEFKEQHKADQKRQMRNRTIEDFLLNKTPYSLELFEKLRPEIESLNDQIYISPTIAYLGFWINNKIFLYLYLQKNRLKMQLVNPYKDYIKDGIVDEKLIKVPETHGWGDICEYSITLLSEIDQAKMIIQKALENVIKNHEFK